jgi:hypothetical protein
MSPIRLTDAELDTVLRAARPIAYDRRDEFLQRVASELQRCGELGDGVVHRICAAMQKEFFDPPISESGRWAKYS